MRTNFNNKFNHARIRTLFALSRAQDTLPYGQGQAVGLTLTQLTDVTGIPSDSMRKQLKALCHFGWVIRFPTSVSGHVAWGYQLKPSGRSWLDSQYQIVKELRLGGDK